MAIMKDWKIVSIKDLKKINKNKSIKSVKSNIWRDVWWINNKSLNLYCGVIEREDTDTYIVKAFNRNINKNPNKTKEIITIAKNIVNFKKW